MPRLGRRRASHHRKLGSGIAPERSSGATVSDIRVVAAEIAGDPDPGEHGEDRRSHGGEARVGGAPVGRVCREREQDGQVGAQAVERTHGRVRVGHRDVNVLRHRRFPAGEGPHRSLDVLVTGTRGDGDLRARGQRVGAGRGGAQRELRTQGVVHRPTQHLELRGRVGDDVVRGGLQLEHAGVRFGGDVCGDIGRDARGARRRCDWPRTSRRGRGA